MEMAHLDRKALLALQDQAAQQDPQVLLELLVQQVLSALLVRLDQLVHKESRGLPET